MKREIQIVGLLLMITSATTTLSCKKDNDKNAPPPKTKTELLTTGSWKRTALISAPAYDWYADGNFATDVLSAMWPCEKDNLDIYKTNGVFETDEGATKCDASDPQTWSVSWRFTDNETKLLFDGYDEYILVELTDTKLRLRSTFVEGGVTYTHDETYGH